MALPGEEIRRRLTPFAAKWSVYDGTERSEAQTFLNELFDCYGQSRAEVAEFERRQTGGFVDMIWPGVCLIEMKAPKEAARLDKHRAQALAYWREASDPDRDVPAPRYVVICAFRRLEIWEPGMFPKHPRLELELAELPDQWDALSFLAGDEPVFTGGQAAVTREAVGHVVDLYHRLRERKAGPLPDLRALILQSVWCLFAEDLGQLPERRFSGIVKELIDSPKRSSADDLGGLFKFLNDPTTARPQHGLYAHVPYANGGVFEEPARVHLQPDELELMRAAARFDWRVVEPAIFGSLLEGGLGHDKQWTLGAHYTHEADIQTIIQPTIVAPWRERIERIETHAEAVAAAGDLARFVVLDPACGSGNFLYVAYRELRRVEKRLRRREAELRAAAGLGAAAEPPGFTLANMRGIEIDGFAAALARVTLWMGHKLAVDELDLPEPTLPLADLSGIRSADALRVEWPRADAIVGNPPYHGSQNLRGVLGDEYVEWLKREFGVGVKDFCVYWFRKAHDHLEPGGRAGLVGTNSISQNRARGASLDYIEANGGVITNAVSKHPWPGEAVVNVSIVNWVKQPAVRPDRFVLDGVEVEGVDTSLREAGDAGGRAARLPGNAGRAFQGPIPVGEGFVLDQSEAAKLLALDEADYREVVRPYLVGDDIARDPAQAPTRYIIDFATRRLEECAAFPAALKIVRARVKPFRDTVNMAGRRERWWLFGSPAVKMRAALDPLSRYIAGTRVGKRILFCWCDPWTSPSDATNVFAFEDDYSMGVLMSAIHIEWARDQSSTLRVDIRYTPTSAFETFPWPDPSAARREAIAAASRAVIERRQAICAEREIGLTKLYNQVDEGAYADLRDLHRRLDEAVAAAYAWPAAIARDPARSNALLLDLNAAITAGDQEYTPFPVIAAVGDQLTTDVHGD